MKKILCFGLASVAFATAVHAQTRTFTNIYSFGDSLSDVGSYQVSSIAAVGGGRYTVNSGGGENWTELLSKQLGLTAPCAAMTGMISASTKVRAASRTRRSSSLRSSSKR